MLSFLQEDFKAQKGAHSNGSTSECRFGSQLQSCQSWWRGGLLRWGYGVLTATAAMGAEERRGTSSEGKKE